MAGGSGLKRAGETVAPGIPPELTKCRELAPPIILPPRAKKSAPNDLWGPPLPPVNLLHHAHRAASTKSDAPKMRFNRKRQFHISGLDPVFQPSMKLNIISYLHFLKCQELRAVCAINRTRLFYILHILPHLSRPHPAQTAHPESQ